MPNQFLGDRGTFIYTDDAGTQYYTYRDASLHSQAGTLATEYDGEDITGLPRNLEPRAVFWQDEDGRRKTIPCDADFSGYTTNQKTELEIDGFNGQIVGRRGEKYNYGGLASEFPEDTGGT